jgi:hypothetical protein
MAVSLRTRRRNVNAFVPGVASPRDQGQWVAVGLGAMMGVSLLLLVMNGATILWPPEEAFRIISRLATAFAGPALAVIGLLFGCLVVLRIQNGLDPATAGPAEIARWRGAHGAADLVASVAAAVAVVVLPALGDGPEGAGAVFGVVVAGAVAVWLAVTPRFLPVPDARVQRDALCQRLAEVEADIASMRAMSLPRLRAARVRLSVRGILLIGGLPGAVALVAVFGGADLEVRRALVVLAACAAVLSACGIVISTVGSIGRRRARAALIVGPVVATVGWVLPLAAFGLEWAVSGDSRVIPFIVVSALFAIVFVLAAAPRRTPPRRWSTRAAIIRVQLANDQRTASWWRQRVAQLDERLSESESPTSNVRRVLLMFARRRR